MPANLDDSDFYSRDRDRHIRIRICLEHPRFSAIEFDTSRPQYVLKAHDRQGNVVRGFNNAQREELAFGIPTPKAALRGGLSASSFSARLTGSGCQQSWWRAFYG